MTQKIRLWIAVAVCVLLLWGGAAWAQPSVGLQPEVSGASWSAWLVELTEWLEGLWPAEPSREGVTSLQGRSGQAGGLPSGPTTADGETCRPGLWESCAADPDG
jgi:hypothetical protein